MLAFRLPLLEKIDIIRKSRSRFHTFNHCQYCTRDLILFSLLRSDVFAIDRLQLLTIMEREIPQGEKFACKGQVEHWLGKIDIGSIATVEKLPVLRNRLESTEYFFLQDSLFKIFAHFLEDSCTEILEEVRCNLVDLLEDLKQNEQSFKMIITTCQIKFRNNLNKLNDILPIVNVSPKPSISLHRTFSGGSLETIGINKSPVTPVLAIPDPVFTPHSHGTNSDSENCSYTGKSLNDASQTGEISGISLFNNSFRISTPFLSPVTASAFPKMLPVPTAQQTYNLSPVSLPDNPIYFKYSSHNKQNVNEMFHPVASI